VTIRRTLVAIALLTASVAPAQTPAHSSATLKVSDRMPSLAATDQFAVPRAFANLTGVNGLVVVFFKSADW
jgi:hypothetical protein